MSLQSPVTATVIDIRTQQVLSYRSTKHLLGENYHLLNRHRNLKTQQQHRNHTAQKYGSSYQFSNSELGEYLDRLFAKAIIELARTYQAGSIALPKLDNIRSSIKSELDAIAQAKIPGYIEGQKRYLKQVRINLHHWSYHRLSQSIVNKASQTGIAIEYGNQPIRASPNEQTREIAMSAYRNRQG